MTLSCPTDELVLSPVGTLTQLQDSDSCPLARRERRWMRRGETASIGSLEQKTQLRVQESTEESLYTVQNDDIITDVIMTSQ
jgi:hypothetical protein